MLTHVPCRQGPVYAILALVDTALGAAYCCGRIQGIEDTGKRCSWPRNAMAVIGQQSIAPICREDAWREESKKWRWDFKGGLCEGTRITSWRVVRRLSKKKGRRCVSPLCSAQTSWRGGVGSWTQGWIDYSSAFRISMHERRREGEAGTVSGFFCNSWR